MYNDMTKILSDKKQGSAEIKHFTIEEYNYRLKLPMGSTLLIIFGRNTKKDNFL